MEMLSGGCLCGAVRFSCSEEVVLAGHCQCTDCQKVSGAGHLSNIGVPSGSVTVTGELQHHSHSADSGNTVTRGFCAKCGCDVHTKNSGMPQFEFLRAGTLDNLEWFKPTLAVFTASGASWDVLSPSLQHFEGMPDGM